MVQNPSKTSTLNKLPDLKLKNLIFEDTNEGIKLNITQPIITNNEEPLLSLWVNERHKKNTNVMMFRRDGNQLFIGTPELSN